MKRKQKDGKRLTLSRETLATLDPKSLEKLMGGKGGCQESHIICSEQHTCVSCETEAPVC